jgi:hypothetical protein
VTRVFLRESIKTSLALAVMLRDAYTRRSSLLGEIEVKVADVETAVRKPVESTFLFATLPAGMHAITVRSTEDPPLYLPVDLAITLPMTDPLWPAFPDRSVANLTLPFDSPLQTPLFRSQFLQASLIPSAAYPFPGDATLIRGSVSSAMGPLDDVGISDGAAMRYRTGTSGEFVVFVSPYQPSVTLTFQRTGFSDSVVPVSVPAQGTAIVNVLMT